MVLSKIQGPATPVASTGEVVAFLREFKALECSCCDQLIGFQHRVTGAIFCAPDCAGQPAHNGKATEMTNGLDSPDWKGCNNEMISASTIQKSDKNPFFRNIPSVRDKEKAREPIVEHLPVVPVVDTKIIKAKVAAEEPPKPKPLMEIQTPVMQEQSQPKHKPVPLTEIKPLQPKPLPLTEIKPLQPKPQPVIKPVSPKLAKVEDVTDSVKNVAKPGMVFAKPSQPVPDPVPVAVSPSPAPAQSIEAEASSSRRHMWKDCTFSPSLRNGAQVKASFIWNLSKLQVCANRDEKALAHFQEKLSEHVQSAETMTEAPIVDQIVLGEYMGDFYRARVTSVLPDGDCRILFVDFGDAIKIKWSQLYDISDELMKSPVWSVAVDLFKVKKVEKKLKPSKKLHEVMYQLTELELLEPLDLEKDSFKASLWFDAEKSLNSEINEFIKSAEAAAAAAN